MHRHVMTLTCPDRPGIVHAVSAGLLKIDGNIAVNAQFSEPITNTFCIRTEFTARPAESDEVRAAIAAELTAIGVDVSELFVRPAAWRPRVMIMVSRYDHCLVDLLYRWQNGSLTVDIPVVVSNHDDLRATVESAGIPFRHLPVTADTKPEQEAAVLGLVQEFDIDLVVLARYMQILSDRFVDGLEGRIINIHHSFLPGFKGARPYHQAYDRGVKLVGATAHFVTADLDEGPIIEQDVVRVDHSVTPQHLVQLGQDVERLVLARAVQAWAEERVLMVGHKTVVF